MIDHGAWIAMGVALIAGILAGLFNGFLVGVVRVQPIVATLGLFIAGRGLALMIADGRLTEIFDPTIRSIGTKQIIGGLQAGVLVAIGLAVIVGVLMRSTIFGKRVVAIGGSPQAARTAGLPVRRSLDLRLCPVRRVGSRGRNPRIGTVGCVRPVVRRAPDRAERNHRSGRRGHLAGRWGDQGGRHRRGRPADAADLRHLDPPRPVRRGRPDGAGGHHRRRRLHPTGPAPMTADTTTRASDDSPLEDVAAHWSRGSVTSLIQRSAAAIVLVVVVLVGVDRCSARSSPPPRTSPTSRCRRRSSRSSPSA